MINGSNYKSEEKDASQENDTFSGRKWGAEQKRIDREIQENGHPIINKAMFVNYAKERIDAALDLLQKQSSAPQEAISTLQELQDNIDDYFKNIDYTKFHFLKVKLDNMSGADPLVLLKVNKQFNDEFNRIYDENILKLQQLNVMLAHLVDADTDAEKVIKQINEKANEQRALNPRPIQQNQYAVDGTQVTSSHIPEGWLTPEQVQLYKKIHGKAPPDGPYTGSSTIRDARQVGQANAIRTEIKVGNTRFTGHRHGSPSVLKIKDDAQRQHRTLQNVKQTASLLAQNQFNQLTPEEQRLFSKSGALTIDMASMSLLSPVMKGDKLDPMKQYRQVEDMRRAHWSLQGRTIPLILLNAQGEEVTVKVNFKSTFMSIGVNAIRGIGTTDSKALVQRVNNRGINQFIDTFLANIHPTNNPSLTAIISDIKTTENDPEIIKYKNQLLEFNHTSLPRLHSAYEALESYNKKLAEGDTTGEKDTKKLKSDRKDILKTIASEEKKLDIIYKKLSQARQKAYSKQIKKWRGALEDIQNHQRGNKDFIKMRLFVDAVDIYYNQPQPGIKRFLSVRSKSNEKKKIMKKIEKIEGKLVVIEDEGKRKALKNQAEVYLQKANEIQAEINHLNKSNYRFQTPFLILADQMGQAAEWQCKSGEDRTGLLNEQIEAYCIYMEMHQVPPRWDNTEDTEEFHRIMQHVHNGAPNRETCAYNDGGPGLKVSDKDFDISSVSYEKDKKMANVQPNSSNLHPYTIKEKILHAFGKPSKSTLLKQEQSRVEELRLPVDAFLSSKRQKDDMIISPEDIVATSSRVFSPSHLNDSMRSELKKVDKSAEVEPEPASQKSHYKHPK